MKQIANSIAPLLVMLSLGLLTYAQTASPVTINTPSPSPTILSQSQPNDEVTALRAQLETMRQYDQRLLDTVYWALGAMGGVVLLVVGLGWYTNFRIYRRDVDDMKRDINTLVDSMIASLRRDMLTEAQKAGESVLSDTLRDIKKMQYQLLESESEKWKREGVFENALSVNSEMLELAIDRQNEYWVRAVIDSMLSILKTQKLSLLDTTTTSSIMKVLDKLPKEYSTEIDSIKEILKTKRTH